MKSLVFLLFLILPGIFPGKGYSQRAESLPVQDKPLRVELPAKSDRETYRVIPCGKEGLLMFFRSSEQVDDARIKWYFTLYDKNLQQIWVKSIPLGIDQDFGFQEYKKDTLFLLFQHIGKTKSVLVDFQVLRVLLKTGTFILNPGSIKENQEIISFSVNRNLAWLGFNTAGGMGQFSLIDLTTGKFRSFSPGQGSQISIRWVAADSMTNGINAIVSRQISKKVSEHYLVRYDTAGVIRSECPLNTNNTGYEFTHFRVLRIAQQKFLLLGSYGLGGINNTKKKEEEEVSTGFFAADVSGSTQKSIFFYNFLELKNASCLLNDKDVMALRKKSMKKGRSLGEYSVDYPLILREVVRNGNQFILIGEVYSPQFRTESYTDFDFYGRPQTSSYSVFDGFRYQSAIIAGFDEEGKLLWDNILEIRNLVSFEATPKVACYSSGDNLVLAYLSDGKIGYKIIRQNDVIEKLDYTSLDLMYPDDKLISESRGKMVPWYDNYFICSGYQEIKNVALESNNKRMVYYFNKVRFEK